VTVNVYGATFWLSRDVPKLIAGGVVVRWSAGANVVTVLAATYGTRGTSGHFTVAPLALGIKKKKMDATMITSVATGRNHAAAPDRDRTRASASDI
jgi:hypothetical protein